MQQAIKINKPCTVYVSFERPPNWFNLLHEKHGLYHFRDLQGKVNRIKFNVVHSGVYRSNVPFKIEKVVPIEIPSSLPDLPAYERDEVKDVIIRSNDELNGSPARIYYKEGIIEKGKNFNKLPFPARIFILLHEVGHLYYGLNDNDYIKADKMPYPENEEYLKRRRAESETKCDLFALVHFLQMGHNRSMAYYSLSKVLSRSQDNVNRLKKLLSNIQKTQSNAILGEAANR